MKLEDILALGIAAETAKQVLDLHNGELNAEQKKVADLTAELETAKNTVADLTDQVKKFDGEDIDGLKKSVSDWQDKYDKDIAALKLDKALELELAGAKARDVGIVKSQLDSSLLKLGEDGKLIGLTEQLDKLRTDKAFLFDNSEAQAAAGARIDTGLDHGAAAAATAEMQARAVMGLPTGNGGNK